MRVITPQAQRKGCVCDSKSALTLYSGEGARKLSWASFFSWRERGSERPDCAKVDLGFKGVTLFLGGGVQFREIGVALGDLGGEVSLSGIDQGVGGAEVFGFQQSIQTPLVS